MKNLAVPKNNITFALDLKTWFRSSVGLEQQPSKLWVLGSNPNGITLCADCLTSESTANYF